MCQYLEVLWVSFGPAHFNHKSPRESWPQFAETRDQNIAQCDIPYQRENFERSIPRSLNFPILLDKAVVDKS